MRLALAVLVACMVADPAGAQMPQTFPMSFEQFRMALDAAIRADTLSPSQPNGFTMKRCQRRDNRYDCSFSDAGFQGALREWRRTGLISERARVPQVLHLTATTSGGQVNRIVVTSVRDDMINLVVLYLSMVVAVMRVFEPGIAEAQGEVPRVVKQLGLMRGDADPTIGRPATMTIPGELVSCTNWDSHVTAKVECVFTPL